MPARTEDRSNVTGGQVVQIQTEALLLSAKNPRPRAVAPPMQVQYLFERPDYRDGVFRLIVLGFAHICAPDRAPHVQVVPVEIAPLKPPDFAFTEPGKRSHSHDSAGG